MKSTTKSLGMGLLSIAVMFVPLLSNTASVQARDFAAYDQYNECKGNNRRRIVYMYYSGDWERYDSHQDKPRWEESYERACSYIMKGKW